MPGLFLLSCLIPAQVASLASVQPESDKQHVVGGSIDLRFDLDGSTAENEPGNATALAVVQIPASASTPLGDREATNPAFLTPAKADPPAQSAEKYSGRMFMRQAASIPWRLGGAAAVITATGIANWNWGSSPFYFKSEGWFGKDTSNLGMDKLGHAYSAYVLAEFLTDGIDPSGGRPNSTVFTGAILSMGLMTYIEIFDGFSKDHGFSPEDLAMDAAGALFAVARRSIPGLREKVDFRLLYKPSSSTWRSISCFPAPHCDQDGETNRSPITDYNGQRYLLAFKLAGFGQVRDTPLRFLEFHAGYYARGFTKVEEERGDPLRRRLFVGAGLNIGEVLFPRRRSPFSRAARSVLEWIQVPYTAIHSD
jgi:hypothetical protein